MSEERTQGTADDIKGRVREAYGDVTGDQDQKEQGQAEQNQGKSEKVAGDIKQTVEDLTGNS